MRFFETTLLAASLALLTCGCMGEDAMDVGDDSTDTGATSMDTGAEPCVSGTYWTHGDQESPLMHPGGDCLGCHQSFGEAEEVVLAGTVFFDADEVIDCNGVEGVTVTITDSMGMEFQTTTNSAGNFLLENVALVPPYSALLTWEGRERAMSAMQTATSCNSCHTETGEQGAPGRIMAP